MTSVSGNMIGLNRRILCNKELTQINFKVIKIGAFIYKNLKNVRSYKWI